MANDALGAYKTQQGIYDRAYQAKYTNPVIQAPQQAPARKTSYFGVWGHS
jgi:hypothetical protein